MEYISILFIYFSSSHKTIKCAFRCIYDYLNKENKSDWLKQRRAYKEGEGMGNEIVSVAEGNLPNSTRFISRYYVHHN